ncbi:DUF853 family protein [Candidatus Woesearchaeota archaeon]|nr:DUF853 family protein [Candidatus Woesearchaeota archaeon]
MITKNKLLYIVLIIILAGTASAFTVITGHAIKTSGSFNISNQAPIIQYSNYTGDAGDIVDLSYSVSDPNNDNITINFTHPLNSTGQWNSTLSDTGITYANITASDGGSTSSAIVTISLSPYCGDNLCNTGESCANCQSDCGTCPSSTSSSGGGGGGGGSSRKIRELQAEIERLTNITEQQDDFNADIEDLFIELQEDEFRNIKITLSNNEDETVFLKAELSKELKDSILLDSEYIMVPPGEKELDFLALANKPIGKYYGSLMLISSTSYKEIPITFKVIKNLEKPELETLDIDVDILTQKINPGDTLRFKLNLRKAPLVTEDPEDVFLKYLVMGLDTDYMGYLTGAASTDITNLSQQKNEVIYEEENITLENALSIPKELDIPDNFKTGTYVLNIDAKFKGKRIPLFAKFKVDVPWYAQKIFNIEKGILALLALLLSVLWIVFILSRVKLAQRRRYSLSIDSSSLPKKGKNSLAIGKIAEKDRYAYLYPDDLKTHSLISGSTGCGKTIAAQVIVEEAVDNGVSVIVFDPTSQWTGFAKRCSSKDMFKRYPEFGMKKQDAKQFKSSIYRIEHPRKPLDIGSLGSSLNIILLDKLEPKELNRFISATIKDIFKKQPKEHSKLKTLLVFDEVHRLLPKFGGSKAAYTQLERAVREFRKWGIGIVLISQVTKDLIGPIESNISTEVQMRTNDREDMQRVKDKYGEEILRAIYKSPTGTGLFNNSSYNNGKPYFVAFRPVRHSIEGLEKEKLQRYIRYSRIISELKSKISSMSSRRKNLFDLKVELELAEKQIDECKFDVADIYLKSLIPKVNRKFSSKKRKTTGSRRNNKKDRDKSTQKIKEENNRPEKQPSSDKRSDQDIADIIDEYGKEKRGNQKT